MVGAATPVHGMADLVRRAAAATPDKAALLFHDQLITWAELDARVDAAAAGLQQLGLTPGDRVGLRLGNTPEFVVAYFGLLRAALVAVPLGTGTTRHELHQALSDSGAAALVVERSASDLALATSAELPQLATMVVCGPGEAPAGAVDLEQLLARGAEQGPVSTAAGGEQLAVLLYTSGTSGRPKGAMLSHRALLANLEQGAAIDPPVVGADDVVLLVLPLFHVYGLNTALGAVAHRGATGLLVPRFDPVDTLAAMARHAVSSVVGAPPMYVAWSMLPGVEAPDEESGLAASLQAAFASVRVAISGAAPLPAAAARRLRELTGRHVHEGYGLTETAPVLSSTLMSEAPTTGSIGQALPGVELRLVDAEGADVEEGDPGEIRARGDNLFSGYWPDGDGGPDDDGWWSTGDVAYADAHGDLHLVDRTTELILVSGFNVYPREVEEVLTTHPDVAEAAVLGIPHPYTGSSVKAFVVLVPGARLSAEDVIAHAARSLARFKCPTTVELVASLPHGVTGKVRKGQLREREA